MTQRISSRRFWRLLGMALVGPLVAAGGAAHAQPGASPAAIPDPSAGEQRLTYGGFGTLGLLYHDEDGIEYRRSENQPAGAEAGELDFATDTLAGAQVNAAWSRQLEVVAQGVTYLRADNSWRPELTRAFVRYDPVAALSLRGGRIGWEIFPRADSRDIGYSQLSIRPAVEVFGFIPTEFFDGGELTLASPVAGHLLGLKLYGGAAGGAYVAADGTVNDLDGSKLWGGHFEDAVGPWVLRLGAGVFDVNGLPSLDALAAGLRQTGQPQAMALADRFEARDHTTVFFVLGGAYDEGPLQARVFLGRTEGDGTSSPRLECGLLTGGYRTGPLTPYATLSFVHNRDEIEGTGLPSTPQYAALNAGAYAAQAATRYNQQNLALGLRYDFFPGLALKAQVDHLWLRDSVLQFDRRPQPHGETQMTLFGVALDFAFWGMP